MANEIREKIRIYQNDTTVALTGNKVNSVRFFEKEERGYRIQRNGYIGIAGIVGDCEEAVMWQKAADNLEHQIPYDVTPTPVHQEIIDMSTELMDSSAFVQTVEQLLDKLAKEFPRFIFSNNISMKKTVSEWSNNQGTELISKDGYYQVVLIIKEKSSANIVDVLYAVNNRQYNEAAILFDLHQLLDHYHTIIDITEGEYPIITPFFNVGMKLFQDMRGDLYATGASMLAGKVGQELFHPQFTLYTDKNPHTTFGVSFFDAEGIVNDGYRYKLIDQGKLIAPYVSKKEAKRFHLTMTGSAVCEYDSVPTIGEEEFYLEQGSLSIADFTKSQKAMYVAMASGGDTTSSGDFASPVQLAYLVEDGKIIGRLPEIGLAGNIFNMFGKDYIGVPCDSLFKYSAQQVIVKMKVSL